MARFRNKRIGNIAIKSPGMDFLRGDKSTRIEFELDFSLDSCEMGEIK